jgi:hypothetical protein
MVATQALAIARAEALFVSDLSAGSPHSRDEVNAAVRRSVRTHHGIRGCAAEMAARYGQCPDEAAARMRWARVTVDTHYGRVDRGRCPHTGSCQ